MRNAVASAWPRTIAASAAVSLRGGSGSRAFPPAIPGRSAANATSSSGRRAMARRHPVTARLNGSFGASLAGVLSLMFEDMRGDDLRRAHTSTQRHINRRFRQFLTKAAPVALGYQRTRQILTL